MDELKEDIKDIKVDIGDMKRILAVNTQVLEIHIKRTNINEKRVEKLEYTLFGMLGAALIALITHRMTQG